MENERKKKRYIREKENEGEEKGERQSDRSRKKDSAG